MCVLQLYVMKSPSEGADRDGVGEKPAEDIWPGCRRLGVSCRVGTHGVGCRVMVGVHQRREGL